ncbi:MAG: acyl carrier protein [Phycisphaerae bacterium]|nr:acyl carrier protein [Phycisphaerae bacterium]
MAMSRQEIFENVKEVLVEALGVDEDEVTEDAKLSSDLGAESIDYLDMVFRLEKIFDIKIPRGELFNEEIFNNPDYVDSGKMTEAGLAKLKESMPHVDFTEFEADPDVNKMTESFTVKTLVNYIESKLGAAA